MYCYTAPSIVELLPNLNGKYVQFITKPVSKASQMRYTDHLSFRVY